MQLETRHFGIIEIDEGKILEFPEGLPGFEDVNKFILLDTEEPQSPFKWLQSIDQPQLAFAVINPFAIKPDYEFELGEDFIRTLAIENEEDVTIYSIVVVPEDPKKVSMNLKAPVVINKRLGQGMQVILDTDKYSVRHYILEEYRGQEVAENACSDKEEGSVHHHK